MKPELLEFLRCPRCGASFTVTTLSEDEREIREAHLICAGQRHFFEVRGGILRLCTGFDHDLVKKELAYENSTYHGDSRLTDPEIISQFPETLPDLWPHTANFGPDFADLVDRINVRPGDWTLDIGTGPCWTSRLLAERGARVIALDVNEANYYGLGAADILFDKRGVYFERILESMTRLPFADNSIDRITFNASFHHTPDMIGTLAECARVLKPDGVIAMVNEEFGSLRRRLFPVTDCTDTGSHHEIAYRAFEGAAGRAGFKLRYHVAGHVRRRLERLLSKPLGRAAVKLMEAFPLCIQQLNSALIVLTKDAVSPAARRVASPPGNADLQNPVASAAAAQAAAPPIVMLGTPFDNVTTAQTVSLIEKMVASRRPHHLVTANVDFLTQAVGDVELRRVFNNAHMVLCDGTPLLWASRLLGNPLPERVAGSDLVPLLIKVAEQKGHRLYLLGGSLESNQRAVANLQSQYPSLRIVGSDAPPFAPLEKMDHEAICGRITRAQPDLLFVAFGCPKQEKWIAMHYKRLGVPVVVGVGATIDFLAGMVRRAPRWMQAAGLEWMFRLAQEPRRLCGRYARDLVVFATMTFRQWWLMQRRARSFASDARHFSVECERALAGDPPWQVDLSRLRFIDSTGMGLLARLDRNARWLGRPLVLVAPTPNVRSALALMRLDEVFAIAPDKPRFG